jgi:RNase H-fold protein (predicted Holliday junction resolvase)
VATLDPVVLAVDPGRSKCGVAVCSPHGTLAKAVIAPTELPGIVRRWIETYKVTRVVVGNLTGSDDALRAVGDLGAVPIAKLDESGTTLGARGRYFADHPRRGWRRLIPLSLQTPPEPYDDYVAVLLAERALADRTSAGH